MSGRRIRRVLLKLRIALLLDRFENEEQTEVRKMVINGRIVEAVPRGRQECQASRLVLFDALKGI
jgi:hypothetical protein